MIFRQRRVRWPRRPRRSSPGRRGAFLMLFGFAYVALGYSYTGSRPTDTVRTALRLAEQFMPLWGYGLLWVTAGLVMVTVGALYAQTHDGPAFGVASAMPSLWALAYLVAWLHGDSDRGWVNAIIFLAFAAAIQIVAGMIDPARVTALPTGDRST